MLGSQLRMIGFLESPHPLADWVAAAKPGLVELAEELSLSCVYPAPGTRQKWRLQLGYWVGVWRAEDTTAAAVACWTDYPADQSPLLPVDDAINGLNESRSREVHPPSALTVVGGHSGRFSAWRSPSSNE